MVKATKRAQELAEEHGIDISSLEGSGKTGNILVADVEAAIAASSKASDAASEEASADTEQQDDSSSKKQEKESPAEKWARLEAAAQAASPADVLDGKVKGLVVVDLEGDDRVIAKVKIRKDGSAYIKYVYANNGQLGSLLGRRPGILFPKLHDAAGREMPKRGDGAKKGKKRKKGKKSSAPSPAEVLKQASQEREQKLAKSRKLHAQQLAELQTAMEQWEGTWIDEIADRRRGDEGLAFFQVNVPGKKENERAVPIAGLILYRQDSFMFVAVVAQDATDGREVRRWHNQLAGREFGYGRDEEKLGGWARFLRKVAEEDGTSAPLRVPNTPEYDRLRETPAREEQGSDDTTDEAAEAAPEEVVEETVSEDTASAVAEEQDTATSEESASADTEEEASTEEANEDTTLSAPIGSDDPGSDPEMQALLADLKDRGIGSKSNKG